MSFVSNRGHLPLLAGVWNRALVASRRGVSVGVATGAVAGPLQLSQCSLVFGGHVFAEQDDGLSEPLFAVRERMQVFCGEVPLPVPAAGSPKQACGRGGTAGARPSATTAHSRLR